MKIVNLKFALLTIVGLSIVSCKKEQCHECHYEKNDTEVELGEKCGNDLKDLETNGYNDSGTNYEVHCAEH